MYVQLRMQATRDIIRVGDPWAADLTPLEAQNAETKRVATSSGARRIEISTAGQQLIPLKSGELGPCRLVPSTGVPTKGCNTTMALSTLKHLLISQKLRRGEGPDGVNMPESRRAERLFGQYGRTSSRSSGVKLEHVGDDYSAEEDTCIKAFVPLIAAAAAAAVAEANA